MAAKYEIKATTYDRRGRKIAVGHNTYNKSHTLQAHYAEQAGLSEKIYLHAEVAAIIKSRGKKIHKIKIERYDGEGRPALAAPCPVCQIAIREANISLVEYTIGEDE